MYTTHDFRRANLRKLAESFGSLADLAKRLGYTNSSFIVQMIGPNPIRQVSEETARKFETALDLLPGSLDQPVDISPDDVVDASSVHVRQVNNYRKRKGIEPLALNMLKPHPHNSDMISREQLAGIISMVGRICDETHAAIPTSKFADIISLVLLANDDQRAGSTEDFIRLLLSLTK
jgi:hypothetical protein